MRGFFELQTAADLFEKLKRDYSRLEQASADSRIAFDFVVTAWHLCEWKYPAVTERSDAISRHPILRVCEHLAVGAKHFEPTSNRHGSVAGMSQRRRGSWAPGAWAPGVWAKGFWGKQLVVHLDGEARDHFGPSLTVLELAEHVMSAWSNEFEA